MATLFDTLQQNQGLLKQQGVTDETAQTQQLLRAKSGKAIGGPSVAASNLGEQQAVAQTNQQMQNQIIPQAQLQLAGQQQQAAGIQQKEQESRQEISQQRKFDDLQTQLKVDSTLKDLERNKGQVDTQRYAASLDQVSQALRLQNKQYTDQLQMEGAKARLNDSMQFREQLQADIFSGNESLVGDRLGQQDILSANDRQFKRAMGDMDIGMAWQIFNNDMAAEKQRGMWTGIGSLTTAGVGAYGTYADKQSKDQAANKSNASEEEE